MERTSPKNGNSYVFAGGYNDIIHTFNTNVKRTQGNKHVPLAVERFYLRYVMEKVMLVLVRERRALPTPLELGSHESVTPVSKATKSAEEEKIQTTFITLYIDTP